MLSASSAWMIDKSSSLSVCSGCPGTVGRGLLTGASPRFSSLRLYKSRTICQIAQKSPCPGGESCLLADIRIHLAASLEKKNNEEKTTATQTNCAKPMQPASQVNRLCIECVTSWSYEHCQNTRLATQQPLSSQLKDKIRTVSLVPWTHSRPGHWVCGSAVPLLAVMSLEPSQPCQ